MRRTQATLMAVWREACRHTEIYESTESIARLFQPTRGFGQLIVRSFAGETATVVTVAAAPQEHARELTEDRRDFSNAERQQVLRWVKQGRPLQRAKRLTGTLGLVLPERIKTDVVALPLVYEDQPLGVLLYCAQAGYALEDEDLELVELLREPFSVALGNDRRIHEMAALREAAEEDRGALLRRLGRKSLDDEIVGVGSGLQMVMERIAMVAHSDVPVLILGETGTGKELAARAIHQRSDRQAGPFIRVNCGAIPAELIDSQLFGHDKGSFTGAEQSRQGWFERADRGTLFLDEIGELPLEAQVRFLRVLQDGFVERVGGDQPIHVDVRIVAATHRDLAGMVREGKFREDLWYRLAVFPILLPPLRERLGDVADLAKHFARKAATRFSMTVPDPTPQDVELLCAYDWPGNIRELGAVLDRAAILGGGSRLEIAKALGLGNIQSTRIKTQPSEAPAATDETLVSLDDAIRQHIEAALIAAQGQVEGRRGAAQLLAINPHTLRAKMRKLGIDWTHYRS